ncbi:hypothetical protein MNVI_22600 [Mycobacterium noviomagense]|uniref:Uncharacterized protein n=1 Tax=Mycobacterium noviomagense TaxID=459858 RepID=A0A7I7PEE8_9MYCO|nr:hypothetical protein MNVI_22600 [Mycobacterium noviomagense]
MTTIHTSDRIPYPIPRVPKPIPMGRRVALAAVGTLGVAAALGLGGTIQVGHAPSTVPGSTVTALGPCFGPHRQPIPCPGPGGTVGGTEGYQGSSDTGENPGPVQTGNDPGDPSPGGTCIAEMAREGCHQPD